MTSTSSSKQLLRILQNKPISTNPSRTLIQHAHNKSSYHQRIPTSDSTSISISNSNSNSVISSKEKIRQLLTNFEESESKNSSMNILKENAQLRQCLRDLNQDLNTRLLKKRGQIMHRVSEDCLLKGAQKRQLQQQQQQHSHNNSEAIIPFYDEEGQQLQLLEQEYKNNNFIFLQQARELNDLEDKLSSISLNYHFELQQEITKLTEQIKHAQLELKKTNTQNLIDAKVLSAESQQQSQLQQQTPASTSKTQLKAMELYLLQSTNAKLKKEITKKDQTLSDCQVKLTAIASDYEKAIQLQSTFDNLGDIVDKYAITSNNNNNNNKEAELKERTTNSLLRVKLLNELISRIQRNTQREEQKLKKLRKDHEQAIAALEESVSQIELEIRDVNAILAQSQEQQQTLVIHLQNQERIQAIPQLPDSRVNSESTAAPQQITLPNLPPTMKAVARRRTPSGFVIRSDSQVQSESSIKQSARGMLPLASQVSCIIPHQEESKRINSKKQLFQSTENHETTSEETQITSSMLMHKMSTQKSLKRTATMNTSIKEDNITTTTLNPMEQSQYNLTKEIASMRNASTEERIEEMRKVRQSLGDITANITKIQQLSQQQSADGGGNITAASRLVNLPNLLSLNEQRSTTASKNQKNKLSYRSQIESASNQINSNIKISAENGNEVDDDDPLVPAAVVTKKKKILEGIHLKSSYSIQRETEVATTTTMTTTGIIQQKQLLPQSSQILSPISAQNVLTAAQSRRKTKSNSSLSNIQRTMRNILMQSPQVQPGALQGQIKKPKQTYAHERTSISITSPEKSQVGKSEIYPNNIRNNNSKHPQNLSCIS